MLPCVLLEGVDVRRAGLEGAVPLLNSLVEVHGHDVVHGDHGRPPAIAIDTAVEPVDVTIRPVGSGDILCDARSE